MINWDKYFDHIFCIVYLNNGRYEGVKNELERIGILNSGIFEFIYDVDYKYKDIMHNSIVCPHILEFYFIPTTINHYKIWKISKELKYDRILILEDDVAFLKDLSKINQILSEYDNENIMMYNYIMSDKVNHHIYFSSACYSLDQKGLDVIIYNFENNNFPISDHLFFYDNVESVTNFSKNNIFVFHNYIINKYVKQFGKYTLGVSSQMICSQLQHKNEKLQITKDDKYLMSDKEYNFW